MSACIAPHDAIKRDRSLFAKCERIGVQPGYNDQGERDQREDLILANCTCGSTLAVTIQEGE